MLLGRRTRSRIDPSLLFTQTLFRLNINMKHFGNLCRHLKCVPSFFDITHSLLTYRHEAPSLINPGSCRVSADVPLTADDDDEESGGGGGGADAILFGNNTESRKMIMTTHSACPPACQRES